MYPILANTTSGKFTVSSEKLRGDDGLLPGLWETAPSTPITGESSNNGGIDSCFFAVELVALVDAKWHLLLMKPENLRPVDEILPKVTLGMMCASTKPQY